MPAAITGASSGCRAMSPAAPEAMAADVTDAAVFSQSVHDALRGFTSRMLPRLLV